MRLLELLAALGLELDHGEGDAAVAQDLHHGPPHAAVAADHDVAGHLLDHGQVPSQADDAADIGVEDGAGGLGGDQENDPDAAEGEQDGEGLACRRQRKGLAEPDGGDRDGGHVEGVEHALVLDHHVADGPEAEHGETEPEGPQDVVAASCIHGSIVHGVRQGGDGAGGRGALRYGLWLFICSCCSPGSRKGPKSR